jgi:hypothetical protein
MGQVPIQRWDFEFDEIVSQETNDGDDDVIKAEVIEAVLGLADIEEECEHDGVGDDGVVLQGASCSEEEQDEKFQKGNEAVEVLIDTLWQGFEEQEITPDGN